VGVHASGGCILRNVALLKQSLPLPFHGLYDITLLGDIASACRIDEKQWHREWPLNTHGGFGGVASTTMTQLSSVVRRDIGFGLFSHWQRLTCRPLCVQ